MAAPHLSNVTQHFAISQYPRPGVFPTEFPNSDEPRTRDIKIMGYSLRISHFRYTIWIEFNAKRFRRSKSLVILLASKMDIPIQSNK